MRVQKYLDMGGWGRRPLSKPRAGYRGRVQVVHTTPEMTCGFLIHCTTVISRKTKCHQSATPFLSGTPPPAKNPGPALKTQPAFHGPLKISKLHLITFIHTLQCTGNELNEQNHCPLQSARHHRWAYFLFESFPSRLVYVELHDVVSKES